MQNVLMRSVAGYAGEWIDHAAAAAVLKELHYLLDLSRLDPIPWQPIPILFGEPGTGKSALIGRFMEQVSVEAPAPHREAGYPARIMTLPGVCRVDHVDDYVHRAMWKGWGDVGPAATTLMFVENADALLGLSKVRRDQFIASLRVRWHRFLFVLVGTRELAEVLVRELRFDPLPLPPLAQDAEFAAIAADLLGIHDPVELGRLHRETGGVIGRLIAASRRGKLQGVPRHAGPVVRRLPR